jgi:hypothetical protein
MFRNQHVFSVSCERMTLTTIIIWSALSALVLACVVPPLSEARLAHRRRRL